jgi:hypothetical protein
MRSLFDNYKMHSYALVCYVGFRMTREPSHCFRLSTACRHDKAPWVSKNLRSDYLALNEVVIYFRMSKTWESENPRTECLALYEVVTYFRMSETWESENPRTELYVMMTSLQLV